MHRKFKKTGQKEKVTMKTTEFLQETIFSGYWYKINIWIMISVDSFLAVERLRKQTLSVLKNIMHKLYIFVWKFKMCEPY